MIDVTAEISTRDRYDVLSSALLSLALQTVKPQSLLIFDDGEQPPRDANALVERYPAYGEVFQLFEEYKISWQVIYGQKRGQHFSHQAAQKIATTDWIFRFDDDEVLEPDVLEKLVSHAGEDVGAVAGLVLPPQPSPVPVELQNLNPVNPITDLSLPNIQWFRNGIAGEKVGPKLYEADHLHSTFLYRRGIAEYELSLSPAAHREETIFTYEIKRKGYKLLVDTSAVTWHFRAAHGGIRSHTDPGFWNHDENVFAQKLIDWGVVIPRPEKIVVLDAGRGDHVIIKKLLPKFKAKYPDVIMATCFPDILDGEVEQISIGEARRNLGNLENYSIYKWCMDHNWKGNLVEAFEKMYEVG